jgi:hypothetical protein
MTPIDLREAPADVAAPADPASPAPAAPVADPAVVAADPAVAPAAPVAPPKFDLKLPDKSSLDPAIIERTAAYAATLGLSSNESAQGLLDFVNQESADIAERAVKATMESNAPGGADWTARNTQWKADALADPLLGAGDPGKLDVAVTLAKRALATYGDPTVIDFLEQSGLGSHPATLRLLAKIGRAMAEPAFVAPATDAGTPHDAPKSEAEVAALLYPTMKPAPTG